MIVKSYVVSSTTFMDDSTDVWNMNGIPSVPDYAAAAYVQMILDNDSGNVLAYEI